MATSQMSEFIQRLRGILLLRDGSDAQLLDAFIHDGDSASLATLVRRHGPMVWGVCRRLIHNQQDAEDCFQATFLVLVRRADSIAPREMVGNWLYGVAHRTALKARATLGKRAARERQVAAMPESATTQPSDWNDLQPLLDEELSRLSDKYRAVVVLCDLEGKSRREAAQQLGVPEGTVAGRLARARSLLADRLRKRGVSLSGGALGSLLAQNAASARVPIAIVSSTIEAATTGVLAPKVAALAAGVIQAMFVSKAKLVVGLLLMFAMFGSGGVMLSRHLASGQAAQVEAPPAKIEKGGQEDRVVGDQEKLQGRWRLVDVVDDGDGDVVKKGFVRTVMVVKGDQRTDFEERTGKEMNAGSFILGPNKTPKWIDFTLKRGRKSPDPFDNIGVYSLNGDKLKICFRNVSLPAVQRPTDFTVNPNSG